MESLLLFCATRWGREFLRSHGVYEVVKVCHEHETDEKVRVLYPFPFFFFHQFCFHYQAITKPEYTFAFPLLFLF